MERERWGGGRPLLVSDSTSVGSLSPCQPLVDSAGLSFAKACWPECPWGGSGHILLVGAWKVAGTSWWSLCAGLWVLGQMLGNVFLGSKQGNQRAMAG